MQRIIVLKLKKNLKQFINFFNALFQAERRFSKVKILDLAKDIIPLWCNGATEGEEYFKQLDFIASKDVRLLTAITRGDLAYHHHTEEELEVMIKRFIGFLNEVYSLPQLSVVKGRPRRPFLATLARKPYHTKALLKLIHKLAAELFQSPIDVDIRDSDELPNQEEPKKLQVKKRR